MESIKEKTIVGDVNTDTTDVAEYIDFDRVNFDIPATIATYGAKEMARTKEILANVRGMIGNNAAIDPEFVKQLSNLTGFSSRLETVEAEKNKLEKYEKDKVNAVGVQKLVMAFSPKPGKNIVDYPTLHKEFTEGVEYIVSRFDSKKEETLNTINIRTALAAALSTSSETLKRLHEVGQKDGEKYYNEVIAPLEKKFAETKDENVNRELLLKKEMLNIFKEQLNSIQVHISVIYESITQLGLQSGTDMIIVRKYQDYSQNTSNLLLLQGFVMIESMHQRENISEFTSANNITKGVIEDNQGMIDVSINQATKLMAEGSIDIETLKKLGNQIANGIKLYNEGVEMANKAREKNAVELARLNSQLETLKDGLVIESQQAIVDGMHSERSYSRSLKPATQKKKNIFDTLLDK